MSPKKSKKYIKMHIPREGDMLRDAYIYTSPELIIEDSAITQLKNAAAIPSTFRIIATPDIHQGYGVPIGTVLGTTETVIPAAVGYDINCGMRMITTGLKADDFDLENFVTNLRQKVPLGEGKKNIRLKRKDFETVIAQGMRGLLNIDRSQYRVLDTLKDSAIKEQFRHIEDGGSLKGNVGPVSDYAIARGIEQLATLGGGNHFIEIQRVKEIFNQDNSNKFNLSKDDIVIMIHTGSRGFGHQIGGEYMKIANRETEKYSQKLVKNGLGYLDINSQKGKSYLEAMNCAANFAFINRYLINLLVNDTLSHFYPDAKISLLYDVPHNILKVEQHSGRNLFVHRKGATRAFGTKRMSGTIFNKTGQPVLIPGSMGTSSYVLSGCDGNDETLCSVNHGAGRVMSRTEARGKTKKGKVVRKAAISDDEFKRSMKGIILFAENYRTIKEEAPQAYKDIEEVVSVVDSAGLSRKVAKVVPLAVLKG